MLDLGRIFAVRGLRETKGLSITGGTTTTHCECLSCAKNIKKYDENFENIMKTCKEMMKDVMIIERWDQHYRLLVFFMEPVFMYSCNLVYIKFLIIVD